MFYLKREMNEYVWLILSVSLFAVACHPYGGDERNFNSGKEALYDYVKENMYMNYTSKHNANEMNDALADLPANGHAFEGDIIMDERLRQSVLGQNSKKSAENLPNFKWPHGVVYYKIRRSFVARDLLKQTIKEFENRTCIRFVKRTNQTDYVIYTSEKDMCSSNIGRVGGPQKIYIGNSCRVLGTVEHETMHALGIIHEHSKPDRDDHIRVKWENIKKSDWSNFNKYQFDQTDNLSVSYNFVSVMHYRNDAFTKNGENTIVALGEPDLEFGQRIGFSVGDVKSINNLYNCPSKKSDYLGLFKDYAGLSDAKKRGKRIQDFLRSLSL